MTKDFDLTPAPDAEGAAAVKQEETEGSTFRVSARPVIESGLTSGGAVDSSELPRSYGGPTLCLMARDPHSLFAYWDIDWKAAFGDAAPRERKVQLHVLSADGTEQISMEVEPMAGNCYVTVADAESVYRGEIGYFDDDAVWNRLATSDVITTPPDTAAAGVDSDFATVPFHLSFQRMVDLLRVAKGESGALTNTLADLQERAASPASASNFSSGEHELARVIAQAREEEAGSRPRVVPAPEFWTRAKLERILGFGGSSPAGGFGGSSWSS